jgi:predicted alpha/beta hydrolase family esterase
MTTREATVLIVPGLRDHVPQHWQTLLASRLPRGRTVAPMGRGNLDCLKRVEAIEEEAAKIDGPIIVVAHSDLALGAAHAASFARRIAGNAGGFRSADAGRLSSDGGARSRRLAAGATQYPAVPQYRGGEPQRSASLLQTGHRVCAIVGQ